MTTYVSLSPSLSHLVHRYSNVTHLLPYHLPCTGLGKSSIPGLCDLASGSGVSLRNLGIELLQKKQGRSSPSYILWSDPDDLLIMLAKSHLVFPPPGSTIPRVCLWRAKATRLWTLRRSSSQSSSFPCFCVTQIRGRVHIRDHGWSIKKALMKI